MIRPIRPVCWPSGEQDQLLGAALHRGQRAVDCWERWKAVVDRDAIDGGSMGLLPLAYRNIHGLGVRDAMLEWCKGFYRRAWYKNQLHFDFMGRVVGRLLDAGIRQVMLLKGAGLVARYYRDGGLRPMDDFDILVPLDQAPAATALLVSWGWQPKSALPRPHGWDFQDAQDHKLDLHWYTLYDNAEPGIDDDFWAGADTVEFQGRSVQVLSAEDQLLHLLGHGIGLNWMPPLRWVTDGVTVLRSAGCFFDWARFVEGARRRRLTYQVHAGLTLLHDKLDVAVPEAILDRLKTTATGPADLKHYEHRVTGVTPVRTPGELWEVYRREGHGTLVGKVWAFAEYWRQEWGSANHRQVWWRLAEMDERWRALAMKIRIDWRDLSRRALRGLFEYPQRT